MLGKLIHRTSASNEIHKIQISQKEAEIIILHT